MLTNTNDEILGNGAAMVFEIEADVKDELPVVKKEVLDSVAAGSIGVEADMKDCANVKNVVENNAVTVNRITRVRI